MTPPNDSDQPMGLRPPGGFDMLGAHRARADFLHARIVEMQGLFESLDMRGWQESAHLLGERLASDTFRVLVLGEFKRGKSTLINALLGEEILPARAIPCTAVVHTITYSPEGCARLFFRPELEGTNFDALPQQVLEHIVAHGALEVPPLDIAVADLGDYVMIPDPSLDQATSVAQSPYDHVEVRWPLELCRSGIELIDSPGLNEQGTRTRITTEYLKRVDAVLFVMSCQALASQSELEVVDQQIRAAGHRDIFFICNRFDEIREREREGLMRYAHHKLVGRTDLGEEGIFFVSALDALDGRLEHDAARVFRSGFGHLEERLTHFLTRYRGRIKLVQPARHLLEGIARALHEIIPGRRAMLVQSEAELSRRFEQALPALDEAHSLHAYLVRRLNFHLDQLCDEVGLAIEVRQREVIRLLPQWLKEARLHEDLALFALNPQEQLFAIATEVATELGTRLEREQGEWQQRSLQPTVEKLLGALVEEAGSLAYELLHELETAAFIVTGIDQAPSLELGAQNMHHSALERVLAAGGGWAVPSLGSRETHPNRGMADVVPLLGPSLCHVVGMTPVNMAHPATLVPTIMSRGILQGLFKRKRLARQAREVVVEAMSESLRLQARETAQLAGLQVREKLTPLLEAIARGMAREMDATSEQVGATLENLRQGSDEVGTRLRALEATASRLRAIETSLRGMLAKLEDQGAEALLG